MRTIQNEVIRGMVACGLRTMYSGVCRLGSQRYVFYAFKMDYDALLGYVTKFYAHIPGNGSQLISVSSDAVDIIFLHHDIGYYSFTDICLN